MQNDCVAAVLAEHVFGVAKGVKDVVYITLSTGVGAGMISNNKIVEGKGKNAGHFGHTIVKKDGDLCGCGLRGCIETITSGKNIERRAREGGFKWNNDDTFSAKEVFDAYRKDEPVAKAIIQETLEYIAIFLSNIINITDTEMIIMGGSVMHNADIIIPFVQEYITNNSIAAIAEGVEFVLPELGDWVGELGGLSLVFPDSVKNKWIDTKPWTHEKKEKFLTTGESMNPNFD
jgi:glucokinase